MIAALFVVGATMTVPLAPALIAPPTPAVMLSAFKVIVLFVALMVLVPIARTPLTPVPVVRVTPPGPDTLPFKVTFAVSVKLTVPEFADALKLTAPELLSAMLPTPVVTFADKLLAVVVKLMPLPTEPAFEVKLTVEAFTLPEALLVILPPTSTVTVLPLASIALLLLNAPVPEFALKKFKLADVVIPAPTVMSPTNVVLLPTWIVAAVMLDIGA